jgi:hypothetical protein
MGRLELEGLGDGDRQATARTLKRRARRAGRVRIAASSARARLRRNERLPGRRGLNDEVRRKRRLRKARLRKPLLARQRAGQTSKREERRSGVSKIRRPRLRLGRRQT